MSSSCESWIKLCECVVWTCGFATIDYYTLMKFHGSGLGSSYSPDPSFLSPFSPRPLRRVWEPNYTITGWSHQLTPCCLHTNMSSCITTVKGQLHVAATAWNDATSHQWPSYPPLEDLFDSQQCPCIQSWHTQVLQPQCGALQDVLPRCI